MGDGGHKIMKSDWILHITQRAAWDAALLLGEYRVPTLEIDGFIHCSTLKQVLEPANSLYRGQTDLVLLCIDPHRVKSPIRYEDYYDLGDEFPHIYGSIPIEAVTQVLNFPPLDDGRFVIPTQLLEMP